MTGQRSRLRRIAAVTLLAWLFVLMAGVVHACIVAPQSGHTPAEVTHEGHGTSGPQDDTASVPDGAHSGCDQQDAGNQPCEKLCDEPAPAVQTAKPQSDLLAVAWLAASGPAYLVPEPQPQALASPSADPSLRRHPIPIRIAFPRLAL